MKKILVYLLIILFALLTAFYVGTLWDKKSRTQSGVSPTPKPLSFNATKPTSQLPNFANPSPSPTPKTGSTEKTDIANQYRYTSYKHNVSFLYKSNNDQPAAVMEDGNRIYVYIQINRDTDYKTGQYIEFFNKEGAATLQQAMEREFLSDYPKTDCVFTNEPKIVAGTLKNFEIGNIKIANFTGDMEKDLEKYNKCPKNYTMSNGVSYFIYDKNFPTRYAFLSIGQYGIMADAETQWINTIEFIN